LPEFTVFWILNQLCSAALQFITATAIIKTIDREYNTLSLSLVLHVYTFIILNFEVWNVIIFVCNSLIQTDLMSKFSLLTQKECNIYNAE